MTADIKGPLNFATNQLNEAMALVRRFHYSGRPPANVQIVGTWHLEGGLFGDMGPAVAACFFSIPPTRWSEEVWELSRLVRDESTQIPLTGLIARTVDAIRKRGSCDLLVSFADWGEGHHGGIYQAASWNYAGKRDSCMDGVVIDGVFWPGRTCNSTFGTRSPEKLRAAFPGKSIEPHFDIGKHLYWRALGRNGHKKAKRIGLLSLPYPKPQLMEVTREAC